MNKKSYISTCGDDGRPVYVPNLGDLHANIIHHTKMTGKGGGWTVP